MRFRQIIEQSWRKKKWFNYCLLPLSLLYFAVIVLRKQAYRVGLFKSYSLPVTVIVVGNLTVGGSGKTPMVIALLNYLQQQGYRVGVISRGYAAQSGQPSLLVTQDTPVHLSGDEPALIVRKTKAPMAVGKSRYVAAQHLLREHTLDIIISDDGLQHLALQRDIEICLVDETLKTDNRFLLPAGPYREPYSRIKQVDFIVQHTVDNKTTSQQTTSMWLEAGQAEPLNKKIKQPFDKTKTYNAIAGIGQPSRFFNTCRRLGIDIVEQHFNDHHAYQRQDLKFANELPVLMTEKDAVKCVEFELENSWYLPVKANFDNDFLATINERIKRLVDNDRK